MSERAPLHLRWVGTALRRARRGAARGQAMVEFALVLLPVLLLVVGIIQFGVLFGANVTLTNAAREGARAGTIYVYDRSLSGTPRYKNDAKRCGDIVEAATASLGFLSTSSAHFSAPLTSGDCPTPTGETQTNGDITISYCNHVTTPDADCPDTTDPDTSCAVDTREGCLVRVSMTYRSDIFVPFLAGLLGVDSNGRFAQRVTVTMVVN